MSAGKVDMLPLLIAAATDDLAAAGKKLSSAQAIVDNREDHGASLSDTAPPAVFGDFRLGERSLKRLDGVHPDVWAVVQYAIRVSPIDFGIPRTGGVRDIATQHRLMGTGASKTLRSRHLTGHAVDIYGIDPVTGKGTWEPRYVMPVHAAFEQASAALDVPLRWGGDWDGDGDIRERGENDLVHHELPRRIYGGNKHSQSEKAAAFLSRINREAQA